MNIWIPDGLKDIPGDRLTPRKRFMESLNEILSINYDKNKVLVCLESKVFGIGMESYTVGSSEFTMNYAKTRDILPLMDNGHYPRFVKTSVSYFFTSSYQISLTGT